jgi:hypothetical protein
MHRLLPIMAAGVVQKLSGKWVPGFSHQAVVAGDLMLTA